MNAVERFTATFEGRLPDRVPIFGNLLEQGARELGLSVKEYYSRGEYVAEGQLRLRERYGYDNLSAFFYAGRDAEILGCREIIFCDEGPPNVGEMIIRGAADIEALEIPADVSQSEAFAEVAECARLLRREAGGRQLIGASVVASFSLPAILMGIGPWLDLLLNGPESLRRELLGKCSDFCTALVRAYREAGVDGVSYSNPVASADFLTMTQFEELALEWIERDLSRVGPEGITYFNGGGRINPMIEPILERTGVSVFYINPRDDIAEAKRVIGDRGVASGVVNDIRLIDWSEREIDHEVARIMAEGKPGGRFLFGTLVMPLMIPEENISTLFDAARRHGAYA